LAVIVQNRSWSPPERITASSVDAPGPTTRQILIDSALGVFRRKGYEATTVEEIADAASLTTGAIYVSFTSKEHLMAEVVAFAEDRFEAKVRDAVAQTLPMSSARDRLALYLRVTGQMMVESPDLMAFRSVSGTELARQPQIARMHGDVVERRRTFCASLLKHAQPPESSPLTLEKWVDVTLLAAEGLAGTWASGMARPGMSVPAVVDLVEHMVLAAGDPH
jgi:AcrR family transcriptional regulator